MPIANLKRHRSASTSHTQQSSNLSRLKSKLAIFTKFRPFASQNVQPPSPPLTPPEPRQPKKSSKPWKRWSQHMHHRRPSIASSFFQYWRNDIPSYNDSIYEQTHYHKAKKCHSQPRLDLLHQQQQNATQNAQTVPASPHHCKNQPAEDQPTSILVKRDSAMTTTTTKPITSSCLLPDRRLSSSSRHMRHVSSSNITVNSEDLTAKEFADIAGIRILLNQEGDAVDDELDNVSDVVMHTVSTEQPTHFSSCSSSRQPKIWDTDFWFDPNSMTTSSSTPMPRHRSLHQSDAQPRIFNELRQMQSTDKLSNCVIKKGRFEICLEAPADRIVQDPIPPVPIITVNNTEES